METVSGRRAAGLASSLTVGSGAAAVSSDLGSVLRRSPVPGRDRRRQGPQTAPPSRR